jgi:hypothetical protein
MAEALINQGNMRKTVPGTNGGCLSKKPCYFAFILAFLPALMKLRISTVLSIYSG